MIVPVYNVESYLSECLDSVLGQSLRDLEVIAVDDGSTDGSPAILEAYAARDPRLRVVTRANGGLGAARNTGLEYVRGAFLTFVDSDDVIPPGSYRRMVKSLKRSGSDVAVGALARLRRGTAVVPRWVSEVHDRDSIAVRACDLPVVLRDFYTPNKVYRTSFWREHGFRFRETRIFEDQPLVTEVLCAAGTIDVLARTTYLWRQRADGTSISQNMYDVPEIRERQHAIALTREALGECGAVPVLQTAWKWTLIRHHLPQYLKHTTGAALEAAIQMARAGVTSDDVLGCVDCPPTTRALVWLALTRSPQDVAAWTRHAVGRERMLDVRWEAGSAYVVAPDGYALPEEVLRIDLSRSGAHASLSELNWVDGDGDSALAVAGRVGVAVVDPLRAPGTVVVRAHDRVSGRSFEVATAPSDGGRDMDRVPAPRRRDTIAFTAEIPVHRLLADGGEVDWDISVRLTTADLERTGTFEIAHAPAASAALVRDTGDGRLLRAAWSPARGLRVHTTPVRFFVGSLTLSGDDVELVAHGEPPEVVVVEPAAAEVAPHLTAVSADAGHTGWTATIPGGVTDGDEEWWLGVRSGDVTEPLVITDEVAEAARGVGVFCRHDRSGRLLLAGRQNGVVLTSSAVADSGLRVRGVSVGRSGSTISLRGGGVTTREVPVGPSGSFDVVVPFAGAGVRGHRFETLPVGSYELVASAGTVCAVHASRAGSSVLTSKMRAQVRVNARGVVRVHVQPPLTSDELSGRGQWEVREQHAATSTQVSDMAFFQAGAGESAGGSLLAVSTELKRARPDIEQVWAAVDHAAVVPPHARRVIVGSADWYTTRAAARWVVVEGDPPEALSDRVGRTVIEVGPTPEGMVAAGDPGNDALVDPEKADRARTRTRRALGLGEDEVAVFYAPRTRDYRPADQWYDELDAALDPQHLAGALTGRTTVLLRGRPLQMVGEDRWSTTPGIVDVSKYPDVNDLILASDVGVFDYSPIRFTYAATRKPMVFLVPDEQVQLESDAHSRAFVDSTPGPRVHTVDELVHQLTDITGLRAEHAEAYERFVQRYNAHDDGHAAQRFVAAAFPRTAAGNGLDG